MTDTTDGFEIAERDLRLRGPGDFFGTRQAGVPTFRMIDLVRDRELLDTAQREAARWFATSLAGRRGRRRAARELGAAVPADRGWVESGKSGDRVIDWQIVSSIADDYPITRLPDCRIVMRVIAGTLKGRRLKAPTWDGLRPTSDKLRETLFNILAPRIAGARVLDGYAGHRRGRHRGDQPRRGAVTFVEQRSARARR